MERVSDYRNNAEACRTLAGRMPAPQREQLMEMARQWDRIAEERELALRSGAAVPDPRPTGPAATRGPEPPYLTS